MRIAIIGCGGIAVSHAAAIEENPATDLVAVVDEVEAARVKAARAWDCASYASADEMLAAVSPDAVCLCTPPYSHPDLAKMLLESGVNVLCEKPLAISSVDAAEVVDLARERDLVLMVSSKFRFVEDLWVARRMLDEQAIGEPLLYEVVFRACVSASNGWKASPELSGGGVVMDNGPHVFDILSVVMSRTPTEMVATIGAPVLLPDIEDSAQVLLMDDTGMLGRVALSWTYFSKDLDYLIVQGTEGTLRVGYDACRVRSHGVPEWTEVGDGYNKEQAFSLQLEEFVDRVNGRKSEDPPSCPVDAVRFIESIYRSARESCWVAWAGER